MSMEDAMTKTLRTVLLAILLGSSVLAEEDQGGYAGSFMRWGAGVRAVGMGKAFVAVSDDASSVFWNPAGLSRLTRPEIGGMQGILFEDRTQTFASLGWPFAGFSLGAGWMRFGTDDIQERGAAGELLSTFTDSENLFILSGGASVVSNPTLRVALGASLKYFHHSLYTYAGTAFGGDVAALASFPFSDVLKDVSVGIGAYDIGMSVDWNTASGQKDDFPMRLRGGVAAQFDAAPVLLAVDLEKIEHQDLRVHAGAEVRWQVLALRAGLDDGRFTAGAGVGIDFDGWVVLADYAYTTDDVVDGATHYIGLGVRF